MTRLWLSLAQVAIAAVIVTACGKSVDSVEGTYRHEEPSSNSYLKLREGGDCIQQIAGEEWTCRWSMSGDTIVIKDTDVSKDSSLFIYKGEFVYPVEYPSIRYMKL